MKSPLTLPQNGLRCGRLARRTSASLTMALMALFAGLASAQETTPPAPPGTNQAAVKPDSHVEAPNTYQVDLTGGRAKPKPTAQPPGKAKQAVEVDAKQAAERRKDRLVGVNQAWVEECARLGPPLLKGDQTQPEALKEQSLLFTDLLDVMRRGVLSDDTWRTLQPQVAAFAEAGVAEAMAVQVAKNIVYGELSETDVFRPLLEVRDVALTISRLQALVAQSNPDAPFHLGRLAMEGKLNAEASPIQNFATARTLLRTAVSRDNFGTLPILCILDYTESLNPIGDASRRKELAASARAWAKQTADKGDPMGNVLFGRMLIEGVGGYVDVELGEDNLLVAAKAAKKVVMPTYASASAVVGNGSVTGLGMSWKV